MPALAQVTRHNQSFQTALPLALFDLLQQQRSRYATALLAAGKGDYSHSQDLRALSRYLGHLLAEQARTAPAERGGVSLLEISLAVDGFFPELRAWTRHDLDKRHRRRLMARERAS